MKKKNDNELQEQQWFDANLGQKLQEIDSTHKPEIPSIAEFIVFVESNKREIAKKQWRDLILLWLVAIPVVCIMLWMLDHDARWFAIVQLIVTIAAIFYAGTKAVRRAEKQWNN